MPSDADAAEILRICQPLDGIPLAALALQALTLMELHERRERHFASLAAGRRTTLVRQRTLRATIGWSLDRLTPLERALGHGRRPSWRTAPRERTRSAVTLPKPRPESRELNTSGMHGEADQTL
ncbi:hypothetical protein [Muricoccus nepalensis]|uniref:hypothetical protein n=1 Tax=Muricoccus nepalensis TaxID=1854500 RepID=UPI00112D4300|nr:hypothetical protein [Roseomonas nepalensis]